LLLPQFVPQTAPQPKIRQLNWQLGELLGLDFGPRGLKKHGRHSAWVPLPAELKDTEGTGRTCIHIHHAGA
jgi:hypothetical protein